MTKKQIDAFADGIVGLIFWWLGAFLVQWLWRIIIVPVTGFFPLSYWQAFGLIFLCSFLDGGTISRNRIKELLYEIHEELGG
jgi:hypothetical protein